MLKKTNDTDNKIKNALLWKSLASVGFSGYFPFASGTVGSFVTIVALYIIGIFAPTFTSSIPYMLFLLLLIPVGALICQRGEDIWGQDSGKIVFDELAGMAFSIIWLPHSISLYLIAFFAFRFFDIVKLPPARYFDKKVHNGWGVLLDDIFAGIYTNVVMQFVFFLILHFKLEKWV